MSRPVKQQPSFSASQRFGAGFHAILGTFFFVALVVMANVIGARHFKRSSWAESSRQGLSSATRHVLTLLTNEVKVVVFFDPEETLYSPVSELLKEYSLASKRIRVETIDYLREPSRAGLFIATHKLPQESKDFVLFECGGKAKVVHQGELSEYDMSKLMSGQGKEIKRKAFLGERFFTSAIMAVSDPRPARVYFLLGHKEHDRHNGVNETGYSKFDLMLGDYNIVREDLVLSGTNDVPPDCDALIIAGPSTQVDPTEIGKLDRYLEKGGRMLLLFRPLLIENRLEALMAKWGVDVGVNVVVDARKSGSESMMVVESFSEHPTVKPLVQANQGLELVIPRSIGRGASTSAAADAPQVVELARTSEAGETRSSFQNGIPVHNPERDRKGTIPVAASVEKGGLKGVPLDRGATRIVAVGDSQFLDNQLIDALGNRFFALNAVNWLLDRSQLLGAIGPRPVQEFVFTMTPEQLQKVRWILLGGFPGAALIIGILVWLRRRF